MKNWKRLLALLMSGALALSLFACNSADSGETPSTSADPSDSASLDPDADPDATPSIEVDLNQPVLEFSAGVSPTDVMLTVNGDPIPADLFLYMVATNCMSMQAYLPYFGMTLNDVTDTLMEESVNMAVYHNLIRQKAAELGCLPTDAQNAEIRAAMDEADLDTNAPYWGLTDSSSELIFSISIYYDNVLNAATHNPSEQELADYIAGTGDYRVKHILLKTVDDANTPLPDDEIAAKRSQAEDLLAQLQASDDLPALFDQLMNEFSEDGRTEDGALVAPDGYLANPGQMVPEFEEASLALKEGELSGIVESEYGYHIILRLPFTDEDVAEYRKTCRSTAMEALITQWQEEADIVRSDALNNLDPVDFYNRLSAYQQAMSEQNTPKDGGES